MCVGGGGGGGGGGVGGDRRRETHWSVISQACLVQRRLTG